MKRIFTLILTLGITWISSAQVQFNTKDALKTLTESHAYKQIQKGKYKLNNRNKALGFEEAYYKLEYDTANTKWDSTSRTTEYLDNAVSNPNKGIFSTKSENYNGQFYIDADSSFGIIDTSYNSYKIGSEGGIFDTIKIFSYDSANASWIPFIRNQITVNSNKDIIKLESFLNLAVFGLPGGITPFGGIDYYYNSSNQLTHWIEKEFAFGAGLVNADSVAVTTNAAGYRTIDEIHEWNGSSWDVAEKMIYGYNASNQLIDEILQSYDQSSSSFINSNRNKYTYNAQGETLTDTSFSYHGTWDISNIEVRTYTSFGDDLSKIDYAIDNGSPYVFSRQDYFYNASNKRDSVIEQSRQTFSTSSPLRLYEKEIYRYSPFPAGGGSGIPTPAAPSGLTVTPGTKSVVANMNLTWMDNSNNELGFAIERSLDSIAWTKIDSVNMNIVTYDDTNIVSATKYYYRIAAFNASGSSSYSNSGSGTSLSVGITELNKNIFSVYPNPFQNMLIIEGVDKQSHFDLFDINGRLIQSFEVLGRKEINLDALSNGIYFLRSNQKTIKIIKH